MIFYHSHKMITHNTCHSYRTQYYGTPFTRKALKILSIGVCKKFLFVEIQMN